MSLTRMSEVRRQRWLRAHIANACPNCGERRWQMSDEVILPIVVRSGRSVQMQSRALCVVPVVCVCCSLVLQFSMLREEIVPKPTAETAIAAATESESLWHKLREYVYALLVVDVVLILVILLHWLRW
jgi:hypothetical protein